MPGDGRQQFGLLVGLTQIIRCAQGQGPIPVLFADPRGNHHNGNSLKRIVGLQVGEQFEAIHPRHFHIKQNQIRCLFMHFLERVNSIACSRGNHPFPGQEPCGHPPHRDRVVHDHHLERTARRLRHLGTALRNLRGCGAMAIANQRLRIENQHHQTVAQYRGTGNSGHRCQACTDWPHDQFLGSDEPIGHQGPMASGHVHQQRRPLAG